MKLLDLMEKLNRVLSEMKDNGYTENDLNKVQVDVYIGLDDEHDFNDITGVAWDTGMQVSIWAKEQEVVK